MQKSLASRGMQSRLPGIHGNRFLVFLDGFVPAAALEQQVAEKTVSPCGLGVKMRATIREACGQIQVLVTKLEPSLAFIRVERGHLAEFTRRAAKVFVS